MIPRRSSAVAPRDECGLGAELPSLTQFEERLAIGPRRASAGAAAGLAVGLAADLLAQVAERSQEWDERAGILAQIDVLRDRATSAAGEVAAAYHGLVGALDAAIANPAAAPAPVGLREQLAYAAELLLEIGETACDCASLAVVVARLGDTVVRGDATAAAVLASAAADMVAHLVEVNLLASSQHELATRAAQLAERAAASRAAALLIVD